MCFGSDVAALFLGTCRAGLKVWSRKDMRNRNHCSKQILILLQVNIRLQKCQLTAAALIQFLSSPFPR